MTDGGISTLSDLQAHTGTHSLRIVDPDNKAGSEVRSDSLPVATGDLCSVSLLSLIHISEPQRPY